MKGGIAKASPSRHGSKRGRHTTLQTHPSKRRGRQREERRSSAREGDAKRRIGRDLPSGGGIGAKGMDKHPRLIPAEDSPRKRSLVLRGRWMHGMDHQNSLTSYLVIQFLFLLEWVFQTHK